MAESLNPNPSANRKLGTLITAISLMAIAFVTLRTSQESETTAPECLACGTLGGLDLILNLLLFVPLGIGLLWKTGRARAAIVIGLLVTLTIEVLQWRIISGRDASLGDILANGAGAALGAWIGSQLPSWWRIVGPPAARAGMKYAVLASAMMLGFAHLLQPGRSSAAYAIQWGRVLPNTDLFTGRVNWAVLNSNRLNPAENLRVTIRDGERSGLTVSVGVLGIIRPTRRRAEILRIGSERSEAMLLGQRGNTLVFRAFTRAERLRLRSPLIGLPVTMPVQGTGAEEIPGELVIAARSAPGELQLSISAGAETDSVSLLRTIGLTWTLFAPWDVAVGPRWWPANAAWLALLVLPAAFFAKRARRRSGVRARFTGTAAILIILVAMAAVPFVTSLSQTTPSEWIGVFAGLIAGNALASLPPSRAAQA